MVLQVPLKTACAVVQTQVQLQSERDQHDTQSAGAQRMPVSLAGLRSDSRALRGRLLQTPKAKSVA